jgi:hypothetical protein
VIPKLSRLKPWHASVVLFAVIVMVLAVLASFPPRQADAQSRSLALRSGPKTAPVSGVYAYGRDVLGTGATECPDAGRDTPPRPLDRREVDTVERISDDGDDIRANQDFACFPQNEPSIAVNPRDPDNAVLGANDYRLGWATSGFYATSDGGRTWYDGLIPFPSLPSGDNLDGGGDPALAFDRGGVVYYADINFNRTDDASGIFVSRSSNGGFTWSRPCVPIDTTPGNPGDNAATCGPPGDPRQPGDGNVTFALDPDGVLNGSVTFSDKEYIGVGRRPAGVAATCFTPFTRTPTPCDPAVVGSDRVYVTWTAFTVEGTAPIMLSYSDDQGRSWSAPAAISGSAPFCVGGTAPNLCDSNQFSYPVANPTTGHLFVVFENFNTPDENQVYVVRSNDGGQTFQGPFFAGSVYDVNYPVAGATRPDCTARGQQAGRNVLTNTCFRLNAFGNIAVDPRGGAFADDLYVVIADNRNGTRASTNTDAFLLKSTDGGTTWVGPTRVNDDRSVPAPSRDCGRAGEPACDGVPDLGADQWFPWVAVGEKGDVNVIFHDRRLDTDSTAVEWPGSRQRPGNYLTWTWAAQCQVRRADSRECTSDQAVTITQPAGPVDPGANPVPGQNQTDLPFRNFQLSDTPSNMDYSFRGGIFMGDYNNIAIGDNGVAWGMFTDTRNGRSSRLQAGRNPACEQADVFVDKFDAHRGGSGGRARSTDDLFLVTPCPADTR